MSQSALRRSLRLLPCLAASVAAAAGLAPEPAAAQFGGPNGVAQALAAQTDSAQAATEQLEIPEIPDEPKTVDPATLLPEKLAAPVTLDFSETSLREVAEWIQQETGIVVLFDKAALDAASIPLGEPVSDHLDNAPLYLMLNRLRALGLDWYVEDGILYITSLAVAEKRMLTDSYNLTDLLDNGFKQEALSTTLTRMTGNWNSEEDAGEEADKQGSLEWLGDVMFVRQTNERHREITGLVTALRKFARRTFTLDPPEHEVLRQKLEENISVQFTDMPLVRAAEELSRLAGADIRIDRAALRTARIRDREPVSLTLSERKLGTVLRVLLADLKLTWVLRDGVLWITSEAEAAKEMKVAVYDVRDLCKDDAESEQLRQAIHTQTSGKWFEEFTELRSDEGDVSFARAGVMAVRQTERVHEEIAKLLEKYRTALRESKPRRREGTDPEEVITKYYRMHTAVADPLSEVLPQLVSPETWQAAAPDAPGTIRKLASRPELPAPPGAAGGSIPESLTSWSVLIIQQKRAVHEEIEKVLQRIQNGDPMYMKGEGGGFGGGGFGSGFF